MGGNINLGPEEFGEIDNVLRDIEATRRIPFGYMNPQSVVQLPPSKDGLSELFPIEKRMYVARGSYGGVIVATEDGTFNIPTGTFEFNIILRYQCGFFDGKDQRTVFHFGSVEHHEAAAHEVDRLGERIAEHFDKLKAPYKKILGNGRVLHLNVGFPDYLRE